MKVALIAPDSMVKWTQEGEMHFILSHVNEVPDVMRFYREEKKYKMLDNGCYELGYPLPYDKLFELAQSVRADEIVCPDFFRERVGTYKATREFLGIAAKGYRYAAVPQAKNPIDWIGAYQDMTRLEVDVISIPIWIQKMFKSRPSIIGYLLKTGKWDQSKEHHLLGLDNYGELYAYSPGLIRSVDTSLPFSLTHCNIWESCFGDIEHTRVPLDRVPFAPMQKRILDKHIEELLDAASFA